MRHFRNCLCCKARLRDIHQAIAAIHAGHIEKRVNSINHALIVIGELEGVLDFERGGNVAHNLENFYNATRGLMLETSVTNSIEKLKELLVMFTRVRAAWAQVERQVAPSEPTQRLRISSQTQPNYSDSVSKLPPDNSPELSREGWRA
jgi:flagellar biosynthetic protein FliS